MLQLFGISAAASWSKVRMTGSVTGTFSAVGEDVDADSHSRARRRGDKGVGPVPPFNLFNSLEFRT